MPIPRASKLDQTGLNQQQQTETKQKLNPLLQGKPDFSSVSRDGLIILLEFQRHAMQCPNFMNYCQVAHLPVILHL